VSGTEDEARSENDPILLPLLRAEGAEPAEAIIARLISEHTLPVVTRVIRTKLLEGWSHDIWDEQKAEELQADVVVRLLARLKDFQVDPKKNAIKNWCSYVSGAAHHACYEYLREKFPQRHSLKNKLRYALETRPGLAAWEVDGDLRCGLAAWRGRRDDCSDRFRQVLMGSRVPDLGIEMPTGRSGGDLARLVELLVAWAGGPVSLDDLVNIVARLWRVENQAWRSLDDPNVASAIDAGVLRSEFDPIGRLSDREDLKALWSEIRDLPINQRAALLLNLRGDAIMLLPVTGIASIRDIAAVLGRPPAEFAQLWAKLPLDDAAIAQNLRVSRQQVINLRKSARERLKRRMKPVGNIALG